MTAAFTGLRASELRALTWNDLELERCVVSVSKRADWWGTIGKPKSKAAYREVPLIPRLVNALKACGGNAQLTVLPDSGHGIANEVYARPDLYTWMLSQARK